MATDGNEKRGWFTVFRTDEEKAGWIYTELTEGRLRQGWGSPGSTLQTAEGRRVDKPHWEAAYRAYWNEAPSPQRYSILTRMLDLTDGDVVVIPKMPERNEFTIARVRDGYRFEPEKKTSDFGHILAVRQASIRTFGYRANNDAFLVSGLFARASHRSAISFCANTEHLEAIHQLLQRPSSPTSKPQKELSRAAIDKSFELAAKALRDHVNAWNGPPFEEAVRQAFRDQGYTIKGRRRYDREGGDADIVVSPPATPYGLFLPGEIAVQVKWKQGVDENDEESVKQIEKWAKSEESDAAKYVISSASGFTDKAHELATANNVVLIGGLQTMCFLLGVPDRYREDWV